MAKTQLERKLTLFPLTNIVIANMIGAGIFTTSGLLMKDLQNPMIMLVLWLVGGVIALCGALVYGELGAAIPDAGGEYAFLSRLYHPVAGFLSGWISFIVGFSAPIAASAIGFSAYLFLAFPQLSNLAETTSIGEIWFQRIVAIVIIAMFTVIHRRGIQLGAQIQNGLTILKVTLIIGLIVIGFTAGHGSWHHLSEGKIFVFHLDHFKTIGLSLMWIMFAYSGWNAATYIGSEIKTPERNLPLSLLVGTVLVMLLYFFLNLFYVFAVDPESMQGVISISGLAATRALGQAMGSLISIMIAFALFSSLSAFLILGPRVYFAMARDGVFFKTLGSIHPRSHAPSRAILLQGTIAAIMVLTGSFDQILTYMGFALGIFPLFTVLGVFKLRWTGKSVFKLPGYPITPVLYLCTGTLILILAYFERPLESSLAVGTVLAGLPIYLIFRYRQGKKPSLSSQ